MQYSMKTDKGKVRESNQDGYFVTAFDDSSCFAVVCDGMGGMNGGDIASDMAVKIISERFVAGWRQGISFSSVKNLITTAVSAANICIYDEAKDNNELEGMGTTAVIVYVSSMNAVVANIGDSRAYIVNESLSQITTDHSLMQEMLSNGKLSYENAASFPYKNVITRALGIEEHIDIDFFDVILTKEDSLLLCTDGLTNFVSPDEIIRIVNGSSCDNIASELVKCANTNGGGDNITAVVLTNKM